MTKVSSDELVISSNISTEKTSATQLLSYSPKTTPNSSFLTPNYQNGDSFMDENTLKVLSELEKTQKDFWNVSRASANFLSMLIKISGAKKVVEVGTSNGYSGIWIAKALKETGGKRSRLTTIEYYEKRIELALENFKKCGVDDIITIKQGSACDVLETVEYGIDFAFIDANKSEYINYFELIDPKLRSGGIIAADNITSHADKVAPFVEKIKSDPNYQVEILNLPGGMLLGYKL